MSSNHSSRSDELRRKVEASEAVTSLNYETQIAGILDTMGWRTLHGFYYRDPESSRDREGDVLGQKIWFRERQPSFYATSIKLLVECKSIKDYNLIFPILAKRTWYSLGRYSWIGEKGSIRRRVFETLLQSGLSNLTLPKALHWFERTAHPGARPLVQSFMVEPPPVRYVSSAFRETNFARERDLDSSVLWKAGQGLRSMVKSLQADSLETSLRRVDDALAYARETGGSMVDAAIAELDRSVRELIVYHPILVVEAPLWALLPSGVVRKARVVRLLQLDSNGAVSWWIDVVTRNAFGPYSRRLDRHYARMLRTARARPLRRKTFR